MEIESEDGTKIPLNQSSRTEFGRGSGFNGNDRTVSRRHVSFMLQCDNNQTLEESKVRVQFEVIGKNPMWVREGRTGEIRVFRRGDEGEMEVGDVFCVSGKIPVWFVLKRNGFEFENDFAERLESSLSDVSATGFEPVDVSEIDPVKDFGFLVMGDELDHYPKQMIRDFKNWDWFLEETRKNSDDDEEVEERKGTRRKRKNGGGGDDDWTGESEKDKELVSTSRKVQRPNYSTRSKHQGKPFKNSKSSKNSAQKSIRASKEENEDEDDETLGGFIVEDVELEEDSDMAEDEDDDFDEDDDDVDDNEEIDD